MLKFKRYFAPVQSGFPRSGYFLVFLSLLVMTAPGCGDRSARTYQRGLKLARQKKYDQAVVEMRRLIQMEPDNAKAHNALGQIYRAQNLYTKAIEELTLAVEKNTTDPELPYNLGCLYRDLDDLTRAEQYYRRALEIDPRFPAALYRLGAVCVDRGKPDEAEKYFRSFLAVGPDRPAPGYNNLGVLLWKKGEKTAARDEFRKALEIEPEFSQALYNFGVSSLALDEKDQRGTEALLAYLKANPYAPEELEIKQLLQTAGAASSSEKELLSRDDYLERARGYEKAGQFHLAEKEYLSALKLDPLSSDLHYRLGILYDTFLGDTVSAIQHYETFLSANPKSSRAPEVIARLKEARARIGGNTLAGEGLPPTPPAPLPAPPSPPPSVAAATPVIGADDYYREGMQREQSGETALAISAFQRCLKIDPEYAKAYRGLGKALLAQGEYTRAVSALEKARSLDGTLPVGDDLARSYLLCGDAALSSKHLEESIGWFQKAREEGSVEEADEGLWKAHHAYFRSKYESGDFSAAASHLQSCLDLKSEVADDYLALGDLYAGELKNPGRARTYYTLYLEHSPKGKEAERVRAFLGPTAEPKEKLEQRRPPPVMQARPISAVEHYNRGTNYQASGQLEAARQEYVRAINLKPDFYQAFYNLGVLYNKTGKPAAALAAYKKSALLNPDFAPAQLAIFDLYYHHYKMKNLARPFAVKYVRLAPDTPQAKELAKWLQE